MDDKTREYGRWTKDALIARIQRLETDVRARDNPETLKPGTATAQALLDVQGLQENDKKKKKSRRKEAGRMDPSRYSTRLIALKLAYLGKNYGGFEFQLSTGLPTIEEELWKACVRSCLIFPEQPEEVRWDDSRWEYSKCGRTDRGVSAFGQVIALRVRSNRPLRRKKQATEVRDGEGTLSSLPSPPPSPPRSIGHAITAQDGGHAVPDSTSNAEDPLVEDESASAFDDFQDELNYPRLLNRLLPPDIRILAWCPTTPAEFSARHHCRERQYRYFFTQPAYSPYPHSLEPPDSKSHVRLKDGWLDIEAMRAAAKKFEGLHDFRNFCKVDPSKLLVSFERRIFESDIVEVKDVETALPYLGTEAFQPISHRYGSSVSPTTSPKGQMKFPKVYYFHVRGSAFLWHQIRCMVAVLFMVGQGFEHPSIIDKLLDVEAEPRRPNYVLANETPLVLWDCVFPKLDDGHERRQQQQQQQQEQQPESSCSLKKEKDTMEWVYLGEESPVHQHGLNGLVDQLWGCWRERKMDELLAGQLLDVVARQADITLRRDPRAPRHAPVKGRLFEGGDREHQIGQYQPVLQKSRLPLPEESYDKEARRKGYADAAEWRAARARKATGVFEEEEEEAPE